MHQGQNGTWSKGQRLLNIWPNQWMNILVGPFNRFDLTTLTDYIKISHKVLLIVKSVNQIAVFNYLIKRWISKVMCVKWARQCFLSVWQSDSHSAAWCVLCGSIQPDVACLSYKVCWTLVNAVLSVPTDTVTGQTWWPGDRRMVSVHSLALNVSGVSGGWGQGLVFT